MEAKKRKLLLYIAIVLLFVFIVLPQEKRDAIGYYWLIPVIIFTGIARGYIINPKTFFTNVRLRWQSIRQPHLPPFETKIMKTKATKTIVYATLVLLLIFVALPLLCIYGRYNFIAVTVTPFGIGLCFALLVSVNKKKTGWQLIYVSVFPIMLAILSLVVIAGEGAICLLVFGVVLLLPYYTGIAVGHAVQKNIWLANGFTAIVFICVLSASTVVPHYSQSNLVKDQMKIKMPADKLWQLITNNFKFGLSQNFFFRNGVSYPQSMRLCEDGAGMYLECRYNNGIIKAPVVAYRDKRYFAFTLNDSLVSMREKNLYAHAHTMHIQNHFQVDYGKFEVVPIDSASCMLITTTSFKHKFEPEIYTNLWVAYFLHKLHGHVLQAINDRCVKL